MFGRRGGGEVVLVGFLVSGWQEGFVADFDFGFGFLFVFVFVF